MSGAWQKAPIMGLIVVGILSLAGCTGKLYTDNHEGVPVYPPTMWVEKYETTMLIIDGKIVATAKAKGDEPKCAGVPSSRIAVRPDYTRPQYVRYEHGYLEKYELEVELTDSGMLKRVKTISGPDRGETFKNLAAAAKDAASIAAGAPGAAGVVPQEPRACNSAEEFKEAVPYCKKACDTSPDAQTTTPALK